MEVAPLLSIPPRKRTNTPAGRGGEDGRGQVLGGQKGAAQLDLPTNRAPIGRPLLIEVAPLLSKAAYLVDASNH